MYALVFCSYIGLCRYYLIIYTIICLQHLDILAYLIHHHLYYYAIAYKFYFIIIDIMEKLNWFVIFNIEFHPEVWILYYRMKENLKCTLKDCTIYMMKIFFQYMFLKNYSKIMRLFTNILFMKDSLYNYIFSHVPEGLHKYYEFMCKPCKTLYEFPSPYLPNRVTK